MRDLVERYRLKQTHPNLVIEGFSGIQNGNNLVRETLKRMETRLPLKRKPLVCGCRTCNPNLSEASVGKALGCNPKGSPTATDQGPIAGASNVALTLKLRITRRFPNVPDRKGAIPIDPWSRPAVRIMFQDTLLAVLPAPTRDEVTQEIEVTLPQEWINSNTVRLVITAGNWSARQPKELPNLGDFEIDHGDQAQDRKWHLRRDSLGRPVGESTRFYDLR